jgi:imidazolonepropionase
MTIDLLIKNIGELVCVSADGKPLYGRDMNDVHVLNGQSVAIHQGRILEIGSAEALQAKYQPVKTLDATDKVVTPGFVDPHTHPIFVHTRENEFEMRILGKTYVEISQSGGGIRSTISSTRDASEDLLFELARKRIEQMIKQGTTTCEAKSGYGLSTESELKQLRVIKRLAETLPIDIIPTFMGAHEYPEEYKSNHTAYIDILCKEMLPAVQQQGIAEYCDIFTEAHVYNLEESRKILSRAKELGLKLKMHADEIEPMGGAELAAELGCTSADHLGRTSENGTIALHEKGVIPVLLPATLFSLGSKTYADARMMISKGLPVALATDYNPGSCNCDSMAFVMTLACLQMKMTPAEALAASTINAAAAVNRETETGSITGGKLANLLIWNIPSYKYIPYHIGSSAPETVIAKGKVLSFPFEN